MKKAETTNSETKNFDNKGMKSELMRIIEESGEVEIYGNKFKFFNHNKTINETQKCYFDINDLDSFDNDSDCEPEYKYYVIINKDKNEETKIKPQVYLEEDGLELKIPYGDTAKINLKNHVFCSSKSVKLNEDFSIRSIYGAKDHVMEEESFEGIYLSEFEEPINIHSQNFYTFDKNKNIKGMRQQITFEFDPNYVSEESEEEFEEKLEEKFKKKLEDYKKKLKDDKEELENYEEKLEEKLEDEKMKFNLLKIIKGMNKKKYNNIYLTFKGNNAYALINDKLHFFEKTGKVYEERKDIVREISDGFIVGLTAFKDKAFVKCIRASKNICEDESKDKIEEYDDSYESSLDKSNNSNKPSLGRNVAKIKVFQQRTGQLETTLLSDEYIDFYFRESNFSYLNKINSKKFNVILSEKDFDEKLKKYFDKNNLQNNINKKSVKEDVKENLNKINDNGIKK